MTRHLPRSRALRAALNLALALWLLTRNLPPLGGPCDEPNPAPPVVLNPPPAPGLPKLPSIGGGACADPNNPACGGGGGQRPGTGPQTALGVLGALFAGAASAAPCGATDPGRAPAPAPEPPPPPPIDPLPRPHRRRRRPGQRHRPAARPAADQPRHRHGERPVVLLGRVALAGSGPRRLALLVGAGLRRHDRDRAELQLARDQVDRSSQVGQVGEVAGSVEGAVPDRGPHDRTRGVVDVVVAQTPTRRG